MTFRVLVADPPWQFGDALPGNGRGASKHYATLPVAGICRFGLPPMAADSVLFLWRVAAMQSEALQVVRAWGYTPKTEIVWVKKTARGKRHFGMGWSVRAEHEACIIATRGRVKPLAHSVRSVFEAPVGRHSAKPEAFYALVESLFAGPYAELFARTERPGWSQWGDQVNGAGAEPRFQLEAS